MEKEVKPRGYWTKERVFEEARKYQTRSEFHKCGNRAYKIALKNGWLDEMDWFIILHVDGYWTKERVFEEGLKYRTRGEFQKGCASAYHVARRNKWLDEMDWFNRCDNPVTDPIYVVYRYNFSKFNTVYIGLTMNKSKRDMDHHRKGPVSAFAHANGIDIPEMEIMVEGLYQEDALKYEDKLVKICRYIGFNVLNKAKTGVGSGSIGSGIRKWRKSSVMDESKKYRTRNEFRKGCSSAYYAARKYGWIDEMYWLQEGKHPNGYWTKERVFEEGLKYSTRSEFKKGCSSAYHVAVKKEWITEMDWFDEIIKPHGYWHDKEHIFNEASKYRSRSEFEKGCSRAYDYARINGWLDILYPKAV